MKKLFFFLLAFVALQLNAQDLAHYKQIVKELSSSKYQGRGYAKDGANKAGKYLEKEFTKAGVDKVICQPFTIDINTFAGKMKMWADGKKLTPGVDFSMREYSPGIYGTFPVYIPIPAFAAAAFGFAIRSICSAGAEMEARVFSEALPRAGVYGGLPAP